MAYVHPNYPTKKAFREALARGEEMYVFPPGIGTIPENGTVSVEGPHSPRPHTWYAQVTVKGGKVVKVK